MDAHERLQNGKTAELEGRYEDALEEYLWFHENALAEQPSLYGVRLSFALAFWAELGARFPPAKQALLEVRDKKRGLILCGARDPKLFNDVAAINDYLKDEAASYQLFISLHNSAPEFALHCFQKALPAIVRAQDYVLARSYIPDPQATIGSLANDFNTNVAAADQLEDKRHYKLRLQAYGTNYAEEVRQILEIILNTDDEDYRAALCRASVSGIENDTLRQRVARKLVKKPSDQHAVDSNLAASIKQ